MLRRNIVKHLIANKSQIMLDLHLVPLPPVTSSQPVNGETHMQKKHEKLVLELLLQHESIQTTRMIPSRMTRTKSPMSPLELLGLFRPMVENILIFGMNFCWTVEH